MTKKFRHRIIFLLMLMPKIGNIKCHNPTWGHDRCIRETLPLASLAHHTWNPYILQKYPTTTIQTHATLTYNFQIETTTRFGEARPCVCIMEHYITIREVTSRLQRTPSNTYN